MRARSWEASPRALMTMLMKMARHVVLRREPRSVLHRRVAARREGKLGKVSERGAIAPPPFCLKVDPDERKHLPRAACEETSHLPQVLRPAVLAVAEERLVDIVVFGKAGRGRNHGRGELEHLRCEEDDAPRAPGGALDDVKLDPIRTDVAARVLPRAQDDRGRAHRPAPLTRKANPMDDSRTAVETRLLADIVAGLIDALCDAGAVRPDAVRDILDEQIENGDERTAALAVLFATNVRSLVSTVDRGLFDVVETAFEAQARVARAFPEW